MLSKASIGLRLALAFSALIFLMLLGAALSLTRLEALNREFSRLADERVAKLQLLQDAASDSEALEQAVNTAMMAVGDAQALKTIEAVRQRAQHNADQLLRLAQRAQDDASKALVASLAKAVANFHSSADKVRAQIASGDAVQAMDQLLSSFTPAKRAYVDALQQLRAHERAQIAAARSAAARDYGSMQRTMVALAVISILIAVSVAVLITRAVTGPLRKVLSATEDLRAGAGDLTLRLPELQAEFGGVSTSLNGFIGKLHDIIAQVAQATASVSVAGRELAQGHVHLSNRTEQQASTLQQTNATVMQLMGTVQRNSEHVRTARELAAQAASVSERGGEMIGEVVTTMSKIRDSSAKVAEIVSVIDGIAFQTNILALNAAVEAARAGEQGKGFAVVAAEVRTLAQRAAAAAKQIKALIATASGNVQSGTGLVQEAGQTMTQMVTYIRELSGIAGQVAESSREQGEAFRQISKAVAHLEQVAHQNAALVEQASAATMSLEQQVQSLDAAVRSFRLKDESNATWRSASNSLQTNVTSEHWLLPQR